MSFIASNIEEHYIHIGEERGLEIGKEIGERRGKILGAIESMKAVYADGLISEKDCQSRVALLEADLKNLDRERKKSQISKR